MGRGPDDIRRDIDATRDRMVHTVGTLERRLGVGVPAGLGGVVGLVDAIGRLARPRPSSADAGDRDARDGRGGQRAAGVPLAVGAAAFAVGVVAAASRRDLGAPRSDRPASRDADGAARESAEPDGDPRSAEELARWTVTELRRRASERRIPYVSRMTKSQLVAALVSRSHDHPG